MQDMLLDVWHSFPFYEVLFFKHKSRCIIHSVYEGSSCDSGRIVLFDQPKCFNFVKTSALVFFSVWVFSNYLQIKYYHYRISLCVFLWWYVFIILISAEGVLAIIFFIVPLHVISNIYLFCWNHCGWVNDLCCFCSDVLPCSFYFLPQRLVGKSCLTDKVPVLWFLLFK